MAPSSLSLWDTYKGEYKEREVLTITNSSSCHKSKVWQAGFNGKNTFTPTSLHYHWIKSLSLINTNQPQLHMWNIALILILFHFFSNFLLNRSSITKDASISKQNIHYSLRYVQTFENSDCHIERKCPFNVLLEKFIFYNIH